MILFIVFYKVFIHLIVDYNEGFNFIILTFNTNIILNKSSNLIAWFLFSF